MKLVRKPETMGTDALVCLFLIMVGMAVAVEPMKKLLLADK